MGRGGSGTAKDIFTANRLKGSSSLYLAQIFMTTGYILLTSVFSRRNPYLGR